ncbi:MAG: hypothetical protein RL072_1101, partial [Actinomycetota bacterium]
MLRCPLYYLLRRHEEAKESDRYFDIVFWSGSTPDREFSQFWRRQIPLLPGLLHRVLWKALHVIAWYWQRSSVMQAHVMDLALGKNHVSNSMNSSNYHAASLVENQDEIEVQSCLESLGVTPNSRIALVHVRNSSHDIQPGAKGVYDVNFANASPQNFQDAVDYLIGEGFSVMTVGNHPTSPSGLEGVIEYHSSPQRTALLDFMVGRYANLFLGTSSGALSAVAFHFRVPAMLTNHVIWDSEVTAEPFSYGRAVFLLKSVWRSGAQLSHSEVMSSRLPSSDRALSD